MSAPIDLPDELMSAVKAEAERQGVSLGVWIEQAVRQQIAARRTDDHFAKLRAEADWGTFDRILNRADGDPPDHDDKV